jgi:hypothetical protein
LSRNFPAFKIPRGNADRARLSRHAGAA